jgi:hypothetical protein
MQFIAGAKQRSLSRNHPLSTAHIEVLLERRELVADDGIICDRPLGATLRTPRDGLASRRQYAHYLPHAEEEVHVYGPQSAAALDYVLPLGVESDHKRGSAASIGSPERRRVPIAQRGADARSRPAAPHLAFFLLGL